jgi:dTDP-4-dehydrorhamnose 3,5-epimerase
VQKQVVAGAAGGTMEVIATEIPDVKIIRPKRFGDHRGFFSETYNKRALARAGVPLEFVQDNHSLSRAPGTVRGLHFQIPPHPQDKLTRVVRGAVLDVVVDLRSGSPTFGKHVNVVISAEDWSQIFVPAGFAHGFCTLEPDTEVIYKVTDYYAPRYERGVIWNDPDLAIPWPVAEAEATLSDRDRALPRFSELQDTFPYRSSPYAKDYAHG